MQTYHYKPLILKGSTKRLVILDEDGETAGTLQRFYTGRIQKIVDRVFDNDYMVNMQMFDKHGQSVGRWLEEFRWGMPRWRLQSDEAMTRTLIDVSKNPDKPSI